MEYDVEEENFCPVTVTMSVIGGKWKPIIIHQIGEDIKRFNQIRSAIPSVTQKMLTQQLRELERDGIIYRKVYPVVPPKVEYSLTEYGKTLMPIVYAIQAWGIQHHKRIKSASSVDQTTPA